MVPLKKSGLLHEAVEGKSFLSKPADEAVQGGQASGKLLDVSKFGGNRHSLNGLDLYRIALYAALRDQEAKELVGWYSEDALLRVELDFEPA